MANNKLSEGVGKKIVEALKKQSEIEVNPISSKATGDNFMEETDFLDNLSIAESAETEEANPFTFDEPITMEEPTYEQAPEFAQPSAPAFTNYQQPTSPIADSFVNELDTFEIPSNIAALKKLITQLPTGVTRQTGAQIIRQTMEALGISMKGVLQEAQQVQDGLSHSAKECQNTIQEYKKHIMTLEKQCQNHQRQYSALNELISLFIQTGR
jgi:hypothetical protein